MKNFKLAIAAAAVAVSFSGIANAATTNPLAATTGAAAGTVGSIGTADVKLFKDNAVRISALQDIDFGTVSTVAAAGATASTPACVFSSTGGYSVTIDSANATANGNTQFTMTSGTDDIDYSVEWTVDGNAAQPVADSGDTLGSAGAALAADDSDETCGGTTNATLAVAVTAADVNAAAPGTYLDTLTVTVKAL